MAAKNQTGSVSSLRHCTNMLITHYHLVQVMFSLFQSVHLPQYGRIIFDGALTDVHLEPQMM